MGRGRKPKPVPIGNPGRQRGVPSAAATLLEVPDRPDGLGAEAAAEWGRVTAELLKRGTVTALDRGIITAYCEAWSQYIDLREAVREHGAMMVSARSGLPVVNPAITAMRATLKALASFASDLGITPSSRQRVAAVGQSDGDDKAKLLNIVG